MKRFLFCSFMMLISVAIAVDNEKITQLNKLEKEQKEIIKAMCQLRIKLINDDPSIKKLHKQIMELHKELALKIDSKKEMCVLVEKEKRLNSQISQLQQQLKNNKTKE